MELTAHGLSYTALLGKMRGTPVLKGEEMVQGGARHSEHTPQNLIYLMVLLLISEMLLAIITQD